MALVDVRGVGKTFANGVVALNDVNLRVEAGEIVVVLGASGAGKSTLLRCINGLETPTVGSISVNEIVVTKSTLRAVRREIGMIFQQFNLVPRTSALFNALTGCLGRRGLAANLFYAFPKSEVDAAQAALGAVGLAERCWDRVDKLSGGQQQRVAIARTLVQNPRVVLADEPVASLDPATSEEVLTLLVDLAKARGTALIMNLHQVELALKFGHRIVGMQAGRVVLEAPADALSEADLRGLYR